MAKNTSTWNQFEWITGGDANIQHEKKIDVGAYGEVHKVSFTAKFANHAIVDRIVISQGKMLRCT